MDAGREETYAMDAGERKHHGRRPNTAVGSCARAPRSACHRSPGRVPRAPHRSTGPRVP